MSGSGDDGANFRDDLVRFFPRILLASDRTGVKFLGTYSSSGSGLTTGLVGNGARTYKYKINKQPHNLSKYDKNSDFDQNSYFRPKNFFTKLLMTSISILDQNSNFWGKLQFWTNTSIFDHKFRF